MPRFKDQAICIRHLDWSETSQVVVLLCADQGKVRGLAKGAKRTSPSHMQRFSGGIELLTRGEVVATTKQTAELATITEWDLQDDYYHLRRDLNAHRLGMYAADLVNALIGDLDPHPRTFAALRDFLEALHDPARHQAGLLQLQWTVLDEGGYRPELWRDVHSGEALGERGTCTFDPRAGGLTTRQSLGDGDWRVRQRTVAVLRRVAQDEPIDEADTDTLSRANRLLCVYLRSILERELPTMRYVLG